MSSTHQSTSLPVLLEPQKEPQGLATRVKGVLLHCYRLGILLFILLLIRLQHLERVAGVDTIGTQHWAFADVQKLVPSAESMDSMFQADGSVQVRDESGRVLGYALQTSPQADHLVGFSGPTNLLIVVANSGELLGVEILWSRDTRDHVEQVESNSWFLNAFQGVARDDVAEMREVDAVSGATLTSLAIKESIMFRLGGFRGSLRFPDPLSTDIARQLFPLAESVEQSDQFASLSIVFDSSGNSIGSVLRTSPAADNVVGYQGPTEAWVGLDLEGQVIGFVLGKSYDNEEYVAYAREDDYFRHLFDGQVTASLAGVDPVEAQIEGVSGATMTSMAVTDGILLSAREHLKAIEAANAAVGVGARSSSDQLVRWQTRDIGTVGVALLGILLGLTKFRKYKPIRIAFQWLLIGYLGLTNGDMVSQAMLVGWAQNAVPWKNAFGIVFLSAAAFCVPLLTKHNVYCSHLCPHGAVQQLIKNRLPWRLKLSKNVQAALKCLPVLLLLWCVLVPLLGLGFSLVDIEPFDAWVFRIAGWATICVAIVGLFASAWSPMAYCRFGCPTGLLLGFLRLNAASHRWTTRDTVASGMAVFAVLLFWFF